MKITSISAQIKNPERLNISVDGKYRFSLALSQVVDLGIKIGNEYSEDEVLKFETESDFGKLYARALEYTLMRPHSAKEVKDYLWRKTRATLYKSRTGELKERAGVSKDIAERVFDRLVEKKYIDDDAFARWWIENRSLAKGASRRKLTNELRMKGVAAPSIEAALQATSRREDDELGKIIAKKQGRYPDPQKFMQYLVRQGFSYDDVKTALQSEDDE